MFGVMQHKYIKGVGSFLVQEDRDRCKDDYFLHKPYSLEQIMSTAFATDAHFTCYYPLGWERWPIFRKSILSEIRKNGSDIVTKFLVFDWDNPQTDGHKTSWTEPLWAQFCQLWGEVQQKDPICANAAAIYSTRNGARIMFELINPIPVDRAEEHLVWFIKYFSSIGLPVTNLNGWGFDHSCRDWTRRFRCPLVMRDGIYTAQEYPAYRVLTGRKIDADAIGRSSVRTLAKQRQFDRTGLEMCPSGDALQALLYHPGARGKAPSMTAFHKRAKRYLKETVYFDELFNDVPPNWDMGNRNNELLKMLGTIVPILLRKCGASVRECMALTILPVSTMHMDQDWVMHSWNALISIYEREIYKLNDEEEVKAKKASLEDDILDDMLNGMRSWCGSAELFADEFTGREYVRNHTICAVKHYFYVMNPEGFYDNLALMSHHVIPRIRKTFLNTIVETVREGVRGDIIDKTVTELLNRYSTPVSRVAMRPIGDQQGYIDNIDGDSPELVLSMYKRNPNLTPCYNEQVDQWLMCLGGEHYEKLKEWIGQALAFEEGPICALSLVGNPGAGKKMFVQGLAECMEVATYAQGEDMVGQSSALTRTPFLNVNEDWPVGGGKGISAADKFKQLTGGDPIIINEKYQPQMSVYNPVRVILTANDYILLQKLTKGRDMSLDTRIAIGQRVFHIDIPDCIIDFMNSIGNRATTAKPGARWCNPESGIEKGDFIVARHFLYLYSIRVRCPEARFLVYGNCSPDDTGKTDVFSELLTVNTTTSQVCYAIQGLLDFPQSDLRQHIKVSYDNTRLFVTRYGIYQHIKSVQEERISQAQVTHALLNVMKEKNPESMDGVDWFEIDLRTLSDFVNHQGVQSTRIRTMYEAYRKANPVPQVIQNMNIVE